MQFNSSKFKAAFFDFDGVLSHGRFYANLIPDYPDVYEWIQQNIFKDLRVMDRWMKGISSSNDINRHISKQCKIDVSVLEELFKTSVLEMPIEQDVLEIIQDLKSRGKAVGLISDNMDVLSTIIVPSNKLDVVFDFVINSADIGRRKRDEAGKTFDFAAQKIGLDLRSCLLVDDSETTIKLFRSKGGLGYLFKNAEELKKMLAL